jgi:hypothetical protein
MEILPARMIVQTGGGCPTFPAAPGQPNEEMR